MVVVIMVVNKNYGDYYYDYAAIDDDDYEC